MSEQVPGDVKPPRVVAELGRPETAEETAERKARDRTLRRSRQTSRNLVYSLLVCVGLVVVIVLAVPRGQGPVRAAIDYRSASAQYADTAGQPLLAPVVPKGWQANAAELRGTGGASSWYVGFVTAGDGFAAYSEGLPGDATWLDSVLEQARATGTTRIGGLDWRVYDRRNLGDSAGNVAYALATRVGTTVIAVYGTPSAGDVRDLAARAAADATARGLTGTNELP